MDNAPLSVIFVYPCNTFAIPLPKGYATFAYFHKMHFLNIWGYVTCCITPLSRILRLRREPYLHRYLRGRL